MPSNDQRHFRTQPIAALCRQLLFAPVDKRTRNVINAETLHDQIDPDRVYPFDFINHRITGYHHELEEDPMLVGEAVLPDLRELIDQLSKSLRMPVAGGEPYATTRDLAERFDVSTKSISRWRKLGLRWRWVVDGEGERPRIGFAPEAIEQFLERHGERVQKASQFTRLSEDDRDALLRRARRIAESYDVSMFRVAQHLARRTGRAAETVRQILDQHDREHPTSAIFVNRTGPLTAKQRRVIERASRMGVSVTKIARRYRRTRASIYRAVRQHEAQRLSGVDMPFKASPTFTRDDADAVILRPENDSEGGTPKRRPGETDDPSAAKRAAVRPVKTDDLPDAVAAIYRQPELPTTRLRDLFVRMHYLRFRAAQRRDALDCHDPRRIELDAIIADLDAAHAIRLRILNANFCVVLSVARQHLVDRKDASQTVLLDLLDQGNRALAAAVDDFDPWSKQTFNHFLSYRLSRAYATHSADLAQRGTAQRRRTGARLLGNLDTIRASWRDQTA